MRDLWGGLRIRLRSHAARPKAGRTFGQSRRVQELASTEGHLVSAIRDNPPLEHRKGWGSLPLVARERNPAPSESIELGVCKGTADSSPLKRLGMTGFCGSEWQGSKVG